MYFLCTNLVAHTHRVKYHNLKRERSLNALSLDELSSLWVPPLVFENTADNEAVDRVLQSLFDLGVKSFKIAEL